MTDAGITPEQQVRLEEASCLIARAEEAFREERFPDVEEPLKQALSIQEEVLSREHPVGAQTLCHLADLYRTQDRNDEAEAAYRRVLVILGAAFGPDDPVLVHALRGLGRSCFHSQRYDEALPPYERAVAILEGTGGREDTQIAAALYDLAFLHYFVGRYTECEPVYLRALEIYESTQGPNSWDAANLYARLATLYEVEGGFSKDPEPFFRRAHAACEAAGGEEHADTVEAAYRLAAYLHEHQRDDEANPLFARVLEQIDAAEFQDTTTRWWIRNGCVRFLRESGRNDEADELENHWGEWDAYEDTVRNMLESLERTLGPDHPRVAGELFNLANSHLRNNDVAQADSMHTRALAIREAALGLEAPEVAESAIGLARVRRVQGRLDESEAHIRRALAILERATIPAPMTKAFAWASLALTMEAQGRYGEAKEHYVHAISLTEAAAEERSEDVAEMLWHYANFLMRCDEGIEAETVLARVMRLARAGIEGVSLEAYDYAMDHATVLRQLGREEEAREEEAWGTALWADHERRLTEENDSLWEEG